MARYNVSITRIEQFLIEAKTPEDAVDVAFKYTKVQESKARILGKKHRNGTILEWDHTTDGHEVEEAVTGEEIEPPRDVQKEEQ